MTGYELNLFKDEIIMNSLLAISAIFVTLLIFSGGVLLSLLICLAIVLEYFFLMATIYHWGHDLDVNTFINAIIAFGIVVDYCAHVAHVYNNFNPPAASEMTSTDLRKTKTKFALMRIGPSVFHGGFSTFLAIFPLAFVPSKILQVYFKVWLSITLVGLLHGLVFLPALFSIIGPLTVGQEPSEEVYVVSEEEEKAVELKDSSRQHYYREERKQQIGKTVADEELKSNQVRKHKVNLSIKDEAGSKFDIKSDFEGIPRKPLHQNYMRVFTKLD